MCTDRNSLHEQFRIALGAFVIGVTIVTNRNVGGEDIA
jgi:hypothetical protein